MVKNVSCASQGFDGEGSVTQNFSPTNMACNDRECSVCYSETGPFQKLCCGHTFCTRCVKNWYLKGVAGA